MKNTFGLFIDNLCIDEVLIDSEGDDEVQQGAAEYFFRMRMGYNKIMEEKGFEIFLMTDNTDEELDDEEIPPMPRVKTRRPYDFETFADGYMESDKDYVENNWDAVIWFLENHKKIKKVLDNL